VDVPEIDVDELARRRESGATVVDVREPEEYEEARIPGVVHVPLMDVPERVEEIPAEDEVLVVCSHGGRSYRAAEFLRAQGVDAVNVVGGTVAWIDAGFPIASGPGPD
jgi:rhodanese-related sulfurtransferase